MTYSGAIEIPRRGAHRGPEVVGPAEDPSGECHARFRTYGRPDFLRALPRRRHEPAALVAPG